MVDPLQKLKNESAEVNLRKEFFGYLLTIDIGFRSCIVAIVVDGRGCLG